MKKVFKLLGAAFLSFLFIFSMLPITSINAATNNNSKLLVGYWHNFDNGTGIIKLRDVSPKWDVINVAFGETTTDRAVLEFSPCYGTDEEFKSDVEYLKSQGKDVVLSIGGQNGVVIVQTKEAKEKFINSTIALIDKYGFNGIDIDLESGSGISLAGGDRDFKNPTTPQIVNLIDAIKTICNHYGPDFVLSMAPETAYVQGGYTAYGNIWGAYLPIIYGVRDRLTYIHVQHYNAGGNSGMDGVSYTQGTADYEVAMADMLLNGFPIENNPNNFFPPLKEEQVMIGLPACPSAAPSGGYINPTEMKKALDYIMTGKSFGGKYKLSKEGGYPGFKGLMTWSINWDAKNGNEFLNNYRPYFDNITPPTSTLKAATISNSEIIDGSFKITATIPSYNTATSYKFMEGSTVIASGSLVPNQSEVKTVTTDLKNKAAGTYKYTVVLSDGSKNVTSNELNLTIKEKVDPTLKAATLVSSEVKNNSFTLTGTIPEYNLATSYKFFEGENEISSGKLSANNPSEAKVTKEIQNKAEGTYEYTLVLYDDKNNSIASNKLSIKLDAPGILAWVEYTSYKTGDIVSFNGSNYVCRQQHTALPGWTPAAVPALWQLA